MKPRHLLELLFLSAVWGSSFLFLRIAAPEFGAIPLIAVRVLIAGLVLLVPLYRSAEWPALRQHWRPIFVSGLLSSALPFTLIAYSAIYATSGFVSILNATVPIWSVFVVFFWLGEKPSKLALLGVAVGFCGVVLLNGDKVSIDESRERVAVLSALTATFFYALTSPHRKRYLEHVSPMAVTAGGQLSGAIVLVPLSLFFWPEQMPSTGAWLSAILLGVLCTALAFLMFFRLLSDIGISKTISVAYLIPVSAIVLGFLVLDEPVTWHMLAGGSLILLGVGFTTELIRFRRQS